MTASTNSSPPARTWASVPRAWPSVGVFALRLPGGLWAVVGVSPQGSDDRGRPGALAFHGLLLTVREYRKAGCDPFSLTAALRSDWSAETPSLPPGFLTIEPPPELPADPRALAIASASVKGRRVAREEAGPIDELARAVWRMLPARVKVRASVATWAFGNANRFDPLAVPKLAGVSRHASYVDPLSPDGAGGEPLQSDRWCWPLQRCCWPLRARCSPARRT